jgi:hypothetical protein
MIASAGSPTRVRRRGATTPVRDRGSGTVMALALIAVVLVLTSVIGLLAGAQSARGQAQAAADLAALAGASRLVQDSIAQSGTHVHAGSGSVGTSAERAACMIADEAARRNGAQLTGCAVQPGAVLRVTTSRRAMAGLATATARAGPVSARSPTAGAVRQ